MKIKNLLFSAIFLIIGFIFFYSVSGSDENYIASVQKWRQESELSLRRVSESTIIKAEDSVKLDYYPIVPQYRVNANLQKNSTYETVQINESNGSKTAFVKYGTLQFELLDKEYELTLYQDLKNSTHFLLPFKDSTSGVTTYGAGRMIPLKIIGDQPIVEIDFNRAFNPYCAYNPEYICPITPPENTLSVRIQAGEKTPKSPLYN